MAQLFTTLYLVDVDPGFCKAWSKLSKSLCRKANMTGSGVLNEASLEINFRLGRKLSFLGFRGLIHAGSLRIAVEESSMGIGQILGLMLGLVSVSRAASLARISRIRMPTTVRCRFTTRLSRLSRLNCLAWAWVACFEAKPLAFFGKRLP
jgi:hypothetical protein